MNAIKWIRKPAISEVSKRWRARPSSPASGNKTQLVGLRHADSAILLHLLLFSSFFLALCCARTHASQPFQPVHVDPLSQPWQIRILPELSGLGAQCITEASDGKMWFGTLAGVWSYDGFDWEYYDGPYSLGKVESIAAGPNGEIYVAINSAIRQFKDGIWKPFFRIRDQLNNFSVRKIAMGPDGELWAATSHGALLYRDSEWTLYTSPTVITDLGQQPIPIARALAFPENVNRATRTSPKPDVRHDLVDICVDSVGRVWMATDGGEVLCFDRSSGKDSAPGHANESSGEWSVYNETDGIDVGRSPSLLSLQDGAIWVVYAGESNHATVFEHSKWRRIPLPDDSAFASCGAPIQTSDGTVWLSGVYTVGAFRDGEWKTYSKPNFPIPKAINFLLQSSGGALWIGGPNTEIVRIDYQTTRWMTVEDLNFQWESPEGVQWFLHRDGRIVTCRDSEWTSFGSEDGLIDAPVALIGASSGDVWVAGSHEHIAATAIFDGEKWTRDIHDELSWGVDYRGVLESSDGSMWFSAAVDSKGPAEHCSGILQFKDGQWTHHHQPGLAPTKGATSVLPDIPKTPAKFLLLGESRDERIWAMWHVVIVRDRDQWSRLPPSFLRTGRLLSILTTKNRDLWLGSQQFGAFRFDGQEWTHFQSEQGLYTNSVRSMAEASDGSICVATDRGFSRFDGDNWTANSLPTELTIATHGGDLKASHSGGLWINRCSRQWRLRAWPRMSGQIDEASLEFQTTQRRFEGLPPRTSITVGAEEVQYPGNLSVLWTGAAPWRDPPDEYLQYSYRLDGGEWSAFSAERGRSFFSLPAGKHLLEVRSRDNDFNVDPTPATLIFEVAPPAWQQGWFLGMLLVFAGLFATQSYRVVQERSRLRRVNEKLGNEIEVRKRTQEEFRSTNVRYANQEEALMSLTRSCALQLGNNTEIIQEVTKIAAKTLEVWQTSIWLFGEGRQTLVCRERYRLDTDVLAEVTAISAADFPIIFKTLASGSMLSVEDVSTDPRMVEIANTKLSAAIIAPLYISGSVAGVFLAEQTESPRRWTTDEETFVISVANMISLLFSEEERQRAEENYREAQKMEAIGQLAGGIAHDFNNVLGAMMMQNEILRMGEDIPVHMQEGLEEIQNLAKRAAGLTRQLLLFGSRQLMQTQTLDLNELITNIARMLELVLGEDTELQLRLHPSPLCFLGDAGLLDQLLVNLAVNARDAMPNGGKLVIETSEQVVTQKLLERDPNLPVGRYVCLSVRDIGTGIPEEILPRIFDPFFTTKEQGKGTGLGLATVFGIVKQHNGRIAVNSELGTGTTFRIHFPLTTERIEASPDPVTIAAPTGGSETILLVEDEKVLRRLTCSMLEQYGYNVLTAKDGNEAIQIWKENSERISLLITDIVMPEEMSGVDLARRLQQDNSRLRVIYMTGHSSEITNIDIELQGADSFVAKPFTRNVILGTIRRCLDS